MLKCRFILGTYTEYSQRNHMHIMVETKTEKNAMKISRENVMERKVTEAHQVLGTA